MRRGTLTANPLVRYSGQSGSSLSCRGGNSAHPLAVRAGDLFTIGTRLYMITEDAATDVAGLLTISFTPPLEESPPEGTSLNVLAPTARFLMAGSTVSWLCSPGGFTSIESVELVEDRT